MIKTLKELVKSAKRGKLMACFMDGGDGTVKGCIMHSSIWVLNNTAEGKNNNINIKIPTSEVWYLLHLGVCEPWAEDKSMINFLLLSISLSL